MTDSNKKTLRRLLACLCAGGFILLLILVFAALMLAVRKVHRDRKNGKGCLSCGGNCAGCSLSSTCRSGEKPGTR